MVLKRHTLLRRGALASRPKPLPLGAFPRSHADHLLEKLGETLYGRPRWGLVPEVRSHAGPGDPDVLRRADAIARDLYPPVGSLHRFHGFEVKTSRRDFLRELADPEKSAPIALFCAAWYLVVPAPWKNVVLRTTELPDRWGLIEIGTGTPEIVIVAEEREAERPTPGFEAALFCAALARGRRELASDAPLSAIVRLTGPRQAQLGCGHLTLVPLLKHFPPALPCFSCAAGLPIDNAIVEAAIDQSSREERDRWRERMDRLDGRSSCGCTDTDLYLCMKNRLEALRFPAEDAALTALERPCPCRCHQQGG